MLARPTRADVDDEMIDVTAGLLAQHGPRRVTVQAVADDVGYSKAAVLHHFASKEALQAAALERCAVEAAALLASVDDLPPGPARDQAVIEAIVDLFRRRPGLVALAVAAGTAGPGEDMGGDFARIRDDVRAAFSARGTEVAPERTVAVLSALGALIVSLTVLAKVCGGSVDEDLVALVVQASVRALGHAAPAPRPPGAATRPAPPAPTR